MGCWRALVVRKCAVEYATAVHPDAANAKENLARLEGVKSIRTAKIDTVKSDVVPSDQVSVDGGAE